MKALSIKEPWASMIARGEKTIEVRSWSTKVRGDILLCCSLRPKIPGGFMGTAFAIARLDCVRPMLLTDSVDAGGVRYSPTSFSWILTNVRLLPKPFPVRGQLGIFWVDVEVEEIMRPGRAGPKMKDMGAIS